MSEPIQSLDFDRADFGRGSANLACRSCQTPLTEIYHEANGNPVCTGCRERMEAALGGRNGSFTQAFLYGLGAAAVGCGIFMAVWALLHSRWGLVSIVVGALVGKAVRKGAGGAGGRSYQIVAVVLTYVAITLSYLPLLLPHIRLPASATGSILVILTAVGLSLVFPFLILAQSASGILSLIVLGIGLWEAWKLTKAGPSVVFTGPYPVGPIGPAEASNEVSPSS